MAKRCARGLVVRNLLVPTEQISEILNLHAENAKLSVIAQSLKLPPQTVEEILDYVQRNEDRQSWIKAQVDRALRVTLSDVERGKTDPHTSFVAYRGPTGKVDLQQYRHHRDDLEMLVGRTLDTPAERLEAEREIEQVTREMVAA